MEIRELEDKIIELTNRLEKLEKRQTQKYEFKVGDRVQFKSWEEMEREFGLDDDGDINIPMGFLKSMKFLCGTYATIEGLYKDSSMEVMVDLIDSTCNEDSFNDYEYTLSMLKPAVNEPKYWKFTEDEKVILRNLPKEYNWIARDNDEDILYIYTRKPEKEKGGYYWVCDEKDNLCHLKAFNHLFQTIQWDDAEPCEFRKFI